MGRIILNVNPTDIPDTRVPVAILNDTSGSMQGAPIEEVNKGIRLFYDAIREDRKSRNAAEICLISFNSEVKVVEDFDNIRNQNKEHILKAGGRTHLGDAVNTALDLLLRRKEFYKEKGIPYHQPWLVIHTDGSDNGDPEELHRAITRVREMERNRKLVVFCIGSGTCVDMKTLAQFSERPPQKLDGLKFCEFFQWLSESIDRRSHSTPGDSIPLGSVRSWASIDI